MDPTLVSAAVVVAGIIIVVGLWQAGRHRKVRDAATPPRVRNSAAADTVIAWPPEAARLMNDAERQAFDLLREALPHHLILAHVPVARFVRVPTRQSYAEWMRRIGNTCVDLVVCDASSRVVAAVDIRRNLDGGDPERQQRRHERLHRVLTASGITVQVWREDALPAPDIVARLLLGDLGLESTAPISDRAPFAPSALSRFSSDAVPRPHVVEDHDGDGLLDLPSRNATWFDDGRTTLSSADDLAFSPTVPVQTPEH